MIPQIQQVKAAFEIGVAFKNGSICIVTGPQGRGKTTLAAWGARASHLASKTPLYVKWPRMIERIKANLNRLRDDDDDATTP
mgnify:CR=1 FL=1